MEKNNDSIIAVEKGHFTIELVYPSGTGYFTALKSMPAQVALISYYRDALRPGLSGGPVKHTFVFFALEKCKNIPIIFQQMTTFEIEQQEKEVVFNLIIFGKDENSFFEEKFINYNANSATYKGHDVQAAYAAIPYGYPLGSMSPNDAIVKYGYPPAMEYGFPPNMEYSCANGATDDCAVKYGYPALKYGYPNCASTDDCAVKYGYPALKYGYPNCASTDDCAVKYGYPALKYGYPNCAPTDDCAVKYGYPALKYGYPNYNC